MKGLSGKVAVVTGGSSGIGRATALEFARQGTKVVVADVDNECGEFVVDEIRRAGGEAIFVKTDVSKAARVKQLIDKTVETFGQLDFAVNNAGISGVMASTVDYAEEDFRRVIDINLTGVWLCMKYEIPEMLKQGGGVIVNVSSILGEIGAANAPAYTGAKHGVIGLTKVAALEYAAKGVRVTAVCPAYITTPMIEKVGISEGSEIYNAAVGLHPVKRLGTPEEVADVLAWLCSDGASFITGSPILVDGGYLAQ